jgi:hypothetical protein
MSTNVVTSWQAGWRVMSAYHFVLLFKEEDDAGGRAF